MNEKEQLDKWFDVWCQELGEKGQEYPKELEFFFNDSDNLKRYKQGKFRDLPDVNDPNWED